MMNKKFLALSMLMFASCQVEAGQSGMAGQPAPRTYSQAAYQNLANAGNSLASGAQAVGANLASGARTAGQAAYNGAKTAGRAAYNAPGRVVEGLGLGSQDFITGTNRSLRSGVAATGDRLQNLRQSKTAQQRTILNNDGTRTVNYYDETGYTPEKTPTRSQTYDFFGNQTQQNGSALQAPATWGNLGSRTARSAYEGAGKLGTYVSEGANRTARSAYEGADSAYQSAKSRATELYNKVRGKKQAPDFLEYNSINNNDFSAKQNLIDTKTVPQHKMATQNSILSINEDAAKTPLPEDDDEL